MATVVNFPSGDSSVADVAPWLEWESLRSTLNSTFQNSSTDKASEVRHALELGADEIDLVICYKAPARIF